MGQLTGGEFERQRGVGGRVARAREQSGLSPALLWRDLGIAPRLLELYEGGGYPVPPSHLAAFARMFGVPASDLRGDAIAPAPVRTGPASGERES